MVIPGDNSGKRADSAAERGIRAYDFDFIMFLYGRIRPLKGAIVHMILISMCFYMHFRAKTEF